MFAIGLNDLLCLLLILCVGMLNFALFVWLYLVLLQVAFAFCWFGLIIIAV